MIADDIKEQAGIKLQPDSWYVGDLEQAMIRSDINQKNKGQEAALACIQLLK